MSSRSSRLSAWCLALALALGAATDARAELTPGLHIGEFILYGGTIRFYDVLVPQSYNGSADVPLVVDLHGYNRTKEFQRSMSGWVAVAEAEGFIAVWPQGRDNTWRAGPPCADPNDTGDDVSFIRAMVAAIAAQNRVDPVHIYATGQSCGGAMTHRLACEATDLFAAAAPFSWDVPRIACAPPRAMPIQTTRSYDDIYIFYPPGYHIRDDPNLPILPGALSGFDDWRDRNGCSGTSPDVTEHPGSTSVCERYTNCRDGSEVGLCSVHTDPNSSADPNTPLFGHYAYPPYVLDEYDTTQGAWDFLSRFTLPPDGDADGVPDARDNCPTLANTDQADADSDFVGDTCDSCVNRANPRVAADFLTANPWATLTGDQRDDDHDGYGNKCDAKFPQAAGAAVGTNDLTQFRTAFNKARSADTCGTSGTKPCAIFDLDEGAAAAIGTGDLNQFRLLFNKAPGQKCPTCPLPCTAGTTGSCE